MSDPKLKINLDITQIYKRLCPDCKDKVLDLIATEGVKQRVKDNLKKELEK